MVGLNQFRTKHQNKTVIMRRSGWLLLAVPLAAWIASVAWPALALLGELFRLSRTDIEIRSTQQLLLTSVGWAAAVALGAVVIGWGPGRLLGRVLNQRGFVPLATLILAPICLPAYVVFFAWWQSWPADSAIHRWVVANNHMQLARQITLYLGLICWSWPLVAWCVTGSVATTPAQREELMRLDGANWLRRSADRFRCDLPGLAIGALFVFLATLNNTTCFDLAEVFTFANELRAIEALGANARDVLVAGAPSVAISVVGATVVWVLLSGQPREAASRTASPHPGTTIVFWSVWLLSGVIPLVLFVRNVVGTQNARRIAADFFNLYIFSAANTVWLAGLSAVIGAIVAMGLAAAWQDHRRAVRAIATVLGLGWLIMAVIPGTIIGVALESAYNREPFTEFVYLSPAILIIGHLASFGFVTAILARWLAMREPTQIVDLRRLDGAQTIAGIIQSSRPRILATGLATMAIVFVFSIGEIPVTAKVNPPMPAGRGPLALTLLNDMHYQRPQTIMIAALGMIALALVAAAVVSMAWGMLQPSKSNDAKPIHR